MFESYLTFNFILTWLQSRYDTPDTVLLGYRRHTTTRDASEDLVYTSFDGSKQFLNDNFNLVIDQIGDCLILKKTSTSYEVVQVRMY